MTTSTVLGASAHALLHLALSCAGPRARPATLQSAAHADTLLGAHSGGGGAPTSASARVLPELAVVHPAARVLVQAARSHRGNAAIGSDGGWLLLAVAAGLVVRACHDARESAQPMHLLLAGHQVALQWAFDFFNAPACPVVQRLDWSNLGTLHALVRSRLESKATGALALSAAAVTDALATLVLRAFVAALPDATGVDGDEEHGDDGVNDSRPRVRVLPVSGAPPERSQCLCNAALVDVPLPLGWHAAAGANKNVTALHSLHAGGVRSLDELDDDDGDDDDGSLCIRTLLYNVSLTLNEHDQDVAAALVAERTLDSAGESDAVDKEAVQRALLLELVAQWRRAGVALVASQRLLHPLIHAHCLAAGAHSV